MEKFPIEAERSPLPTFRRGETASPIGEIIDGLSGDIHSRGFFPWTSMILRSARDILESFELISWTWMGAG